MTIDLPKQARAFVEAKMNSGRFENEAEVVSHYLNKVQQWEERSAEIRAKVDEGLEAAREGRKTRISTPEEVESFKQEIIKRGEALLSGRLNA